MITVDIFLMVSAFQPVEHLIADIFGVTND
jgi:hypothetical protein